ncbi:helix-turn-helix domain-containing protein [Kutzneria kofuensis]|uniref:AraC-like DNA-binding protein n=1 Tax=Kutzneria kofuensis TaxID=103725 RepID=A0A7W9NM29_9PSEU|nr:helix-turn-helix domain-containing protein [Kutzneria kofuensis]MBB5897399.1 AraC-like DNA-binding protein [Kutzneria kofuensis]
MRDDRELHGAWRRFQRHDFPPPSPDLAAYVDHYWIVSWSYAEPYRQKIVPYPRVNLTIADDGTAAVTGVASEHGIRVLEGDRTVLGVAFRPGGFRPFLGQSVSTITDRVVPAAEIFGPELPPEPTVEAVEELLRRQRPEPDRRAEEAADIVATIAAKPEITRVDELVRAFGMTVRQLQRLFADYVGINPKWVIRRYRLHEVTERLAKGAKIDWAGLAAELGYADQAHFVRDFTKMFGETPTHYAQRY